MPEKVPAPIRIVSPLVEAVTADWIVLQFGFPTVQTFEPLPGTFQVVALTAVAGKATTTHASTAPRPVARLFLFCMLPPVSELSKALRPRDATARSARRPHDFSRVTPQRRVRHRVFCFALALDSLALQMLTVLGRHSEQAEGGSESARVIQADTRAS